MKNNIKIAKQLIKLATQLMNTIITEDELKYINSNVDIKYANTDQKFQYSNSDKSIAIMKFMFGDSIEFHKIDDNFDVIWIASGSKTVIVQEESLDEAVRILNLKPIEKMMDSEYDVHNAY